MKALGDQLSAERRKATFTSDELKKKEALILRVMSARESMHKAYKEQKMNYQYLLSRMRERATYEQRIEQELEQAGKDASEVVLQLPNLASVLDSIVYIAGFLFQVGLCSFRFCSLRSHRISPIQYQSFKNLNSL